MTPEPLSSAGAIFLLIVGVIVPWGVIRTRERTIALGAIPLKARFLAMLAPQVVLGGLAAAVAWVEEVDLPLGGAPDGRDWLFAAGLLALSVFGMRGYWKQSVIDRDPALRLFLPRDLEEKKLWTWLSLSAGLSEELVWRGVFVELVRRATGSLAAAIAIAVFCFALAHAVQGLRSMFAIAWFALGFHALVLVTGSLVTAMVVHFLYDVIAGFTYSRLADQLGYFTSRDPESPSIEPLVPAGSADARAPS